MKLTWWMLSGSILSSIVLTALLGADTGFEIWLGMLGPLLSALISWIAMQRYYTRRPGRMTSLLIKAFAAKMIFFAAYITVLLSKGWVRPIPFAISFTAYYLCLHIMEAIGLHRLQASAVSMSPDALRDQFRNG
jgi:hypothetical protein